MILFFGDYANISVAIVPRCIFQVAFNTFLNQSLGAKIRFVNSPETLTFN